MPQLKINDSDVAGVGGLRCRPASFKAEHASASKAKTVIDPNVITDDKKSWHHSAPKTLTRKELGLVRSLLQVPPELWDGLWLNQFLLQGMVVTRHDDAFLVLTGLPDMAFAVQLSWDEVLLGYVLEAGGFVKDLILTSWTGVTFHEYTVQLTSNCTLLLVVDEGQTPLDYIMRRTAHLYNQTVLRKAPSLC